MKIYKNCSFFLDLIVVLLVLKLQNFQPLKQVHLLRLIYNLYILLEQKK